MSESLSVIADGTRMGQVTYAKGKLSFSYDPEWLKKPDAYHFSTSMPLSTESYPDLVVDAFLWGLLPDNALVIDNLAKSFKVSARNVSILAMGTFLVCIYYKDSLQPWQLDTATICGILGVLWEHSDRTFRHN